MPKAAQTLHDVFLLELKDLFDVEKRLVKALPKMAKAAHNPELRQAFKDHLEQTIGQVARLEDAFKSLGETPKSIPCEGMKGILEEGEEILKMKMPPAVKDAAIIAAAQKVEHYEIASYGTICEFARLMGHNEALRLLKETMNEEEKADKLLSSLAKGGINSEANKKGM